MKKIALLMVTVFLNAALFSCTPDSIVENPAAQACCGDDILIAPPPPPPPPDEDDN